MRQLSKRLPIDNAFINICSNSIRFNDFCGIYEETVGQSKKKIV